jgi:hypothetical protein
MIPRLQPRRGKLAQVVSVLCVFLVLLVSAVQATHVHPDSAKHDCSLCVVAQAGTIITAAFHATPVLLQSRIEAATDPQLHSQLIAPSLYIRPPPSV